MAQTSLDELGPVLGGTIRIGSATFRRTAHRRRTDSDPGHPRLDRGRGRTRRRLTCHSDQLE